MRIGMRQRGLLAVVVLMTLIAVPLAATSQAAGTWRRPARVVASLMDVSGERVGTVRFLPRGGGVLVRVQARDLTPGFHGFHVHATGVCDAAGGFASAGGHLNPADASHGHHAGDMPVLLVGENGKARAAFVTDRFRVRDLFDADGSAVIVHADADNFANIPPRYTSDGSVAPGLPPGYVSGPDLATLATGDAGGRATCGVVRRR